MRNILINWLKEKADNFQEIILITGDLGYSVLEPYIKEHKSKFLNAGVAEQNMAGIAAGLAIEGFRPYIYSIGIFPTYRCAEQIRNDIDYHGLPVVVCAIGSGVAYGNLGYSHHAIQDLSLMRSLPNMLIGTPCDPGQVAKVLEYNFRNPCPLYLRLHKAGEKKLNTNRKGVFPGQIEKLGANEESIAGREKGRRCILCIGHITAKVYDMCISEFKDWPVYTVPLWGNSASEYFSKQISYYETIVTVEDHVLEGGFGSYTLEVAARFSLKTKIIPIALQKDIVGKVAKEETLLKPLLEELRKCLKSF